ncbi:MAG: hypothetical protein HY360_12310 [Verrucomicrobia bacterium]|nr:hypothetical protein [Verrucomicrobiota bacterium]
MPHHPRGYGDALLMLMTNANPSVLSPPYGLLNANSFSGPGYSGKVFESAVKNGTDVPERECGRVYVQGLCKSNDLQIIYLFDKQPSRGGDHGIGFSKGREVLRIGTIGNFEFVRESEWSEEARKQIELLVKAGISRKEGEALYATPR